MSRQSTPIDVPPLLAVRLNALVGREKEVEALTSALRDLHVTREGPRLAYVQGEGGIGKTRLLEDIGARPTAYGLDESVVCTDIIDLYDAELHSQLELCARIHKRIRAKAMVVADERFDEYVARQNEYRALIDAMASLEDVQERLTEAFWKALVAFSQHRPVAILLDTVETLGFDTDEEGEALGVPTIRQSSFVWLRDRLRNSREPQRILFLVAGRPAPNALGEEIRGLCGELAADGQPVGRFVALGPLPKTSIAEYFKALGSTLQARGFEDAAVDVKGIGPTDQENLWKVSLGRPVALGLAVHFWLSEHHGQLVTLLNDFESENEGQRFDQLKQILIRALAYQTFESYTEPFLILALMRAGMSARNLTRLWHGENVPDETIEEVNSVFNWLAAMSFTKKRTEQRWDSQERCVKERDVLYMHDEIADWVDAYLREERTSAQRRRQALFDRYSIVSKEVEGEIKKIAEELVPFAFAKPKDEGNTLSQEPQDRAAATSYKERLQTFAGLRRMRRRAQFFLMHYGLRTEKPSQGYVPYFELAQEAFSARLMDLDVQIHADFVRWLSEVPGQGVAVDQVFLRSDLDFRWGQRFHNGNNANADVSIDQILKRKGGALHPVFALGLRALGLWRETQKVGLESNRFDQVIAEIDTVADELERWQKDATQSKMVRLAATAILGDVHYQRAYVKWQTGALDAAIAACTQSAFLFRDLNYELPRSNALNDKGYYWALAGDPQGAQIFLQDALELRLRMGASVPLAYSRNTLATVKAMVHQTESARNLVRLALNAFNQADDRFGRQLAHRANSEIARRRWEAGDLTPFERLEDCKFAKSQARLAVDLAEGFWRRAEALNELGSACRDLWHFCSANGEMCGEPDANNELLDEARRSYDDALKELPANSRFDTLRVDIMINQAYLEYYAGGSEKALNLLECAYKLVPSGIKTVQSTVEPAARTQLSWQLPKAEALKIRMIVHNAEKADSALSEADLVNLMDASIRLLEYSGRLKGAPRALERSKQAMYEAYKHMNNDELRQCRILARTRATEMGISPQGDSNRTRMEQYLDDAFLGS